MLKYVSAFPWARHPQSTRQIDTWFELGLSLQQGSMAVIGLNMTQNMAACFAASTSLAHGITNAMCQGQSALTTIAVRKWTAHKPG
eukprot:1156600-Pelagomonas_calceolata.AAC.7